MSELQKKVAEMVTAKVPREKIIGFIKAYNAATPSPTNDSPTVEPFANQEGLSWEQDRPIRQKVANASRMVLEGGGATAGAMVGAASPTPGGMLIGGTLGYAGGREIADRVSEALGLSKEMNLRESTVRAMNSLAEGATYEMGGQSVGAFVIGTVGVLKSIKEWAKKNLPPMSDKGILKAAQDIYEGLALKSPEALKNAKETDKVLKNLDIDTVLTPAQRTGSEEAVVLEKKLGSRPGELGPQMARHDRDAKNQAVKGIDKKFSTGSTVEDVVSGAEKESERLGARAARSQQEASQALTGSLSKPGSEKTGKVIQETLAGAKAVEKGGVDAAFKKVPKDIELSADPIDAAISALKKDFAETGGAADEFPTSIVQSILKTIKGKEGDVEILNEMGEWAAVSTGGKKVTFGKLNAFQRQISRAIRENSSGSNPNLPLVRNLKTLQNGVNDAMEQMTKLGKEHSGAVKAYETAKKVFTAYHDKFRKEAVGETLQRGNTVSGYKVAESDVPKMFFKDSGKAQVESTNGLIRAVGKEKAASMVDDFAGFDLAQKSEGGVLDATKAKSWLLKHEGSLKQLGLYDKYKAIVDKQIVADGVLKELNHYNKNVADKILGADTGEVIAAYFEKKGLKYGAKTMNELLATPGIKGNETAINGIKYEFKNFLMKQMKSGVDPTDGSAMFAANKVMAMIERYEPAMRILYKGESGKIAALKDFHKLIRNISRNKKAVPTAGSPTAEKLASITGEKAVGADMLKGGVLGNIALFAAVRAGAGWTFSTSRNLLISLAKLPFGNNIGRVEATLARAIYDPDAAKLLMQMSKSGKTAEVATKKYGKYMATLGIIGAKNTVMDNAPPNIESNKSDNLDFSGVQQ